MREVEEDKRGEYEDERMEEEGEGEGEEEDNELQNYTNARNKNSEVRKYLIRGEVQKSSMSNHRQPNSFAACALLNC